jgi:hypothetical protein
MNLIDRYVTEIGKQLPRKSRADIETEIRSTLEDMLEERSAKAGRQADDDMVKELLKEYGAPDKVAATYLPERYLIGPKLFPIFWLVLKIVGTVLTVLAIVGFGIRFGASALNAQAFTEIFGKSLIEYIGAIISAFGNIVFIFAILERVLPKSKYENELTEDWDPSELTKEPEPDDVSIWEPIWAIVITIAALLVFNLYPQVIGFGFMNGNTWTFIPVLTDAFFRYLPWIDVMWVLQIALNIILLRQGRWTTLTRWFEVGLSMMSIAIAYLLLKGPALVALNAETLTSVFHDASAAATLARMFNMMPPMILLIIILLEGIDMLKSIYRLVFKPIRVKAIVIK